MKISKIGTLVTLASILITGTSVEAQKIKVLVIDALNGKPKKRIEVNYVCEDGGAWIPSEKVITDTNGIAEVPFVCASGIKIKVSTYIEGTKLAECGEMEGQPIQKIMNEGIISDPKGAGGIWCPAKIRKKMKPVPGEIILFIKKPTWWQSHVAG